MPVPCAPDDLSSRVDALQDSTRMTVHAIGQHLTVILAEAQFLRRDHGNMEEMRDGLDQIINATYQIAEQVKTLHDTITAPIATCDQFTDTEAVSSPDLQLH
jgi:DNA-binding ferritin-like protein